jgi:hypothetical protein
MTEQEIFDKVAAHLLTQGVRSQGGDMCLYRGPDGTKCAAGSLIPDALYTPDIEGQTWPVPSLRDVLPFTRAQNELIRELQWVHDGKDCQDWATELMCVLMRHGLSDRDFLDMTARLRPATVGPAHSVEPLRANAAVVAT